MQKIVCKRSNGEEKIFSNDYDNPLWLIDASGITDAEYDVTTEKLSGQNGESYTGSSMKKRNIVITANIFEDYENIRASLLSFFQPDSKGDLYFYENNAEGKKISYYVEHVAFDFIGVVRNVTVSLICPFPLFSALQSVLVPMSYWVPKLKFPFTFSPPFQIGERVANQITTINNPKSVACGLVITFRANGEVTNPGMVEINSGKRFKLSAYMPANSVLVVSTGIGQKAAKFYDDSPRSEIWHVGDTWLQLQPGENIFQYNADSGVDKMDVTIEYTPLYWGA